MYFRRGHHLDSYRVKSLFHYRDALTRSNCSPLPQPKPSLRITPSWQWFSAKMKPLHLFTIPKRWYLSIYRRKRMKRHSTMTKNHDQSLSYSQCPCLLLEHLGNPKNLEPMKPTLTKTKATDRFHKSHHQKEPRATQQYLSLLNLSDPRAITFVERPQGEVGTWSLSSFLDLRGVYTGSLLKTTQRR